MVREVIYCEDCPIIRLCRDQGHECEFTRWVHNSTKDLPPLSPAQIKTVVTILRTARPTEQKRTRSRHAMGPFKCQVPRCTAAPLKHSSTMWAHVRGVHQITMDEYRQRYGDPRPMTQAELDELTVEAECPVCGKVYSTAEGYRWPRGALTSHLRGRHGLKPDGKTPVAE